MAYCTIEDIKNIIPERELINLTNDYPSELSVIDHNRFEAVSITADSLIDGYLRARYKLPLKSVPLFVKQISQDICAYRLYSRRPNDVPENIVKNYENAIKSLTEIKKGNLILEDVTENPDLEIPPKKSGFRINKRSSSRIFNENVMRAFGLPRGY